MKCSAFDSDTINQLDAGDVYTDEKGLKVVVGVSDTIALQQSDGKWLIAEAVAWCPVEDFRPNKRRLEGLAEQWILAHGTDEAMDNEVADYLEIELAEALEVLKVIAKAAVTITFN